jgi:predicted Fe-S protein YdhL (DUF1289 family)
MSSDSAAVGETVESPCVRICMLDERHVCIGCGRSLAEIAEWSRMSAQQKRAVCAIALERQQARGRLP